MILIYKKTFKPDKIGFSTTRICNNRLFRQPITLKKIAHVEYYYMPPPDLCEGFFGLLCNN